MPASVGGTMPYTHQPRCRARRARCAVLAVLALSSMNNVSASSSNASQVSTSTALGWVLSPEHASDVLDFQEEGSWRLQARQATEEEASSTSSRRRTAAATTTSAAEAEETSASASLADASTVLSIGAESGAVASGDLAVAASTTAGTATSTSSSAVSTSTAVPEGYQLPEAFDSTLGTNFTTTSCPSFFATFLADPTFTACAPFSLLLTTSTAFFTAERSPYSLLPYILDASCSADTSTCTSLMDSLAVRIKQNAACGADYQRGNPLVEEALAGFLNYRLYREASCQKSNSTEQYCFAEAAANSDPDDLYLWYTPEGTTLPSGTAPSCGSCTEQLFNTYSNYASNSSLAISKTYASARNTVALTCGPSFAPVISATTTSSSFRALSPSSPLTLVSTLLAVRLLTYTAAAL
ncbi:hypothetical protein JCM8547_009288 [Rhodosporidiobolus lusitaniae]